MITLPVKVKVNEATKGEVARKLGKIIYQETRPDLSPLSRQGKTLQMMRDKTQVHGAVNPGSPGSQQVHKGMKIQTRTEYREIPEESLPKTTKSNGQGSAKNGEETPKIKGKKGKTADGDKKGAEKNKEPA